jgi:glutathione S-transferase
MPVKLHCCSQTWLKLSVHPCWTVQKALDEAGVDYEIVKHPAFPRSKRAAYIELTGGEKALPAIQLEDGTLIREESKDLAARVRDRRLNA